MRYQSQEPTRVVFTDAGIDDALALIFVGGMVPGGADYVVCNGGNVQADLVANNCAFLKKMFGWESRLHLGSNASFQSECDAAEVHGPCGLAERRPREVDLPSFRTLRRTLADDSGPLDVLVLGPCTDVPELLSWPGVGKRIREMTVMGGAFETAGNVTPFAEFNVYMDPEAAQAVMGSDCESLWVPLDATQAHLYSQDEVLSEVGSGERGTLIQELYDYCAAVHRRLGIGDGIFMHDVLAAAVWLDLVETSEHRIYVSEVIPTEEQQGRILHAPENHGDQTACYVSRLDHQQFLRRWQEVCRGVSGDPKMSPK